MNAKKILKTLGYLPKWAWYLLSFFVAGPFGPLAVYLAFHVLNKIAQEQETDAREKSSRRTGTTYADEECVVTSDEEVERLWQRTQQSAAHAQTTQKSAAPVMDESADVAEVIRAGHDAMRRIRQANDIIEDAVWKA